MASGAVLVRNMPVRSLAGYCCPSFSEKGGSRFKIDGADSCLAQGYELFVSFLINRPYTQLLINRIVFVDPVVPIHIVQ